MTTKFLLCVLCTLPVWAQSAPAFEVASIKPNTGSGNFVEVTPGGITVHTGTLATCLTWAYNLPYEQVVGANSGVTDLLTSERYDIVAKSPGHVSESQLRLMLQGLLAERFKLSAHQESKDLQVYALVVAKNGPKLKESEPGAESRQQAKSRLVRQWTSTRMAQLAQEISGAMGATVVDQTGLAASYDFGLDLTPYLPGDSEQGQKPDLPAMMRSALQDQLGLRLETRKAPVTMLIVDHA